MASLLFHTHIILSLLAAVLTILVALTTRIQACALSNVAVDSTEEETCQCFTTAAAGTGCKHIFVEVVVTFGSRLRTIGVAVIVGIALNPKATHIGYKIGEKTW